MMAAEFRTIYFSEKRIKMAKIICLLGKSFSGKDTIYKKLIADESVDLVPLVT